MLVLLAISTGYIPIDGPSSVDVTVTRYIKSPTEYVHINRVYQANVKLSEEGSQACWLEVLPPWVYSGTKVVLFFLVCVLSGCDFLPAIFECPVLLM